MYEKKNMMVEYRKRNDEILYPTFIRIKYCYIYFQNLGIYLYNMNTLFAKLDTNI